MNTHDIELPPLPLHPSVAHMGGRHMQADCQFPSLYVWAKNYARAAIEPYVETLFKIGEHLGIDYQEARTAPGKPSDVYIAAIEADRKRRGEPVGWPTHEFAIVIDRFYEGEGPSLAMWNGESYQFSDGDHDLYRGEDGSLGGYTAEWLTHRELERRLFCSQQIVKMMPSARPSGYAYRYPDGAIRFTSGGEINGSRPVETIPYWFSAPVAQEPVAFLCRECDEEGWSTYAVMPHEVPSTGEFLHVEPLYAAPQPTEPVACFKCGHPTHRGECVNIVPQPAENSVNLEVAIQAISALHSNDTDWDTSYWNQAVGRCVSELNKLRSQRPAEPAFRTPDCPECGCVQDGQCLCSPSSQPAEPVGEVVVTKDEHGRIVAVTRQDREGRILKVIAISEGPQPAEPSRSEPVGYIMPTALRQLKAGGNAIVGGVSQGCDIPLYLGPQPAKPTFTTPDCPRCGCVQDGQCLCNTSRPSAEPVTTHETVASSSGYGEPVAWLPIETAPEEGCWTLVCGDGAVDCMFIRKGHVPENWTNPNNPNLTPSEVTHWMPLPEFAPQPAEPVKLCDCERGHNGMGVAGRECDCPAEPVKVPSDVDILELWSGDPTHSRPVMGKNKVIAFAHALLARYTTPQPAEPDSAKCAECGAEMIHVRPGKWQHPDCPQSPRAAEPVKVPSDAEMAAIWDEAHKPFGGAPFLMSHVEYSRALLARYGQPTAREDADDLYVAYLCGLADGKKTTNTLPTPKPDPHYEEGATDVFDHAQRQAYVDGWNECLEAIKKGLKRT